MINIFIIKIINKNVLKRKIPANNCTELKKKNSRRKLMIYYFVHKIYKIGKTKFLANWVI